MGAIGIDPGSSAVRFVELEQTAEGIKVVSAISVPTELFGDDTTGEAVPKATAEAGALLDKYADAGLAYSRGVVGLSGRELILRYFKVPVGPEARQQLSIQFEIDEITNNGTDDVACSWTVLPRPEDDLSEDDTVLVALAKTDFVERQNDRLRGLRIKPQQLSTASLGLYNAWLLGGEVKEGETVLVASVGYNETELCLITDRSLVFARNVGTGGKQFAEAAQEHWNAPPIKCWRGLMSKGDMSPPSPGRRDGDALQVSLWSVGDQFFRMLDSSVNFAKLQLRIRGLNVSRVAIGGEIVRMKGFMEFMSSRFKQPVVAFNPFAHIGTGSVAEPCKRGDGDPSKFPHQYAVAAGLARMALEKDALTVRLETRATIERRKFLHGSLFLYGSALIAMITITLLILTANDYVNATSKVRKEVERQKQQVKSDGDRFREAKAGWEKALPLTQSAFAALEPTYQFQAVMRELRAFGNQNDELIVREVKLDPPKESRIRDPHTITVTLYFEEKGGLSPDTLRDNLIKQLTTNCKNALATSSPVQILSQEEAKDDGLPSGMKYQLLITLMPHSN
ncbi:MAG: pilus assembly protein PilM [Planctomycetota bacterium]